MSKQKRVWIHRIEPKQDLPQDVLKNAKRRLSSVLKNGKPLKGLSHEEEKELLPRIIDAHPDEGSEFFDKASTYWKEVSMDIPSGGKDLDISTRESYEGENGEEIPNPVYPEDFVMYKFAKAHPQVAENEQEAKQNPNKLYWILDPEEEKRNKRENVEAKKEAWREFIKMEEDEEKLDLMIRVFADTNPEEMSDKDDKVNELEEQLERRPKRFVEVARDDDLEKQDFVLQCLEYGVLRKTGNQIMYMDEVLGTGVEQVVAYLKNKRNSSVLSELKAKLSEAKGL